MGKENLKAQEIPCLGTRPPHACSACPNSPQERAPGCGSESGPEAAGALAAAAAAAAFPPPRSQSISVQCRLPPPRQAREKEGGPRIGCVLPGGPGPASPPRLPLQHRGQRPAHGLRAERSRAPCSACPPASQPERGRGAAHGVLIPPASSRPAGGGRLRPSGPRSKSEGRRARPPDNPRRMGRTSSSPVRAGISALLPPSGLDKGEFSVSP